MKCAVGVLRLTALRNGRALLFSAALLWGWAGAAAAQQFQDITSVLGLPGSVGAAWGDYDGDGDADLFLPSTAGPHGHGPLLLRNDGALSFSDVSREVGLPSEQMEQDGAAWADYDNDGDLDLLVGSGAGWPLLFRRDEAGFTEVGEAAGFHVEFSAGRGVSWCDYDGDNLLDAFCSNLFGRGFLMHNNGDGTFTEVAQASGLWPCDYGQSAAWGDYNNDGWPDLLLARTNLPTLLFRNDGDGTFTNVSIGSGVSSFLDGFSAVWGDYDNDGWLDCYVTSASSLEPQRRRDALFHNNRDGTFTEVSATAGMAADASVGLGAAWADYDNDGWLDLFVSNMQIGNQAFLYHNIGGGTFTETAASNGMAGSVPGEAAAWADAARDGTLDLFQGVGGPASRLFHNIGPVGNWLRVCALTSGSGDATGAGPVRDAIGARVEVSLDNDGTFPPGRTLTRLIDGGSGYCGQNEQVAHFGLGASALVAVRARFADGSVVVQENVPANQQVVIRDVSAGGRTRAANMTRPQKPAAVTPARAATGTLDPSDSFEGSQIDASRWYVEGDSVAEAGGEVTVRLPAPGTNVRAGLTATWTLRGPFDFQVDYRVLTWPPDRYASLGLLVLQPSGTWSLQRASMEREGSRQLYLADHAPPAGEDTAYGMTVTGDTAGTLRLVRDEHSVLTALMRPAGADQWVKIYSIPVSAEEVRPALACWSGGASPVTAAFDNFRVNRGEVEEATQAQEAGRPHAAPAPAQTSVLTSLPATPLTVGVLPFTAKDEKLASQVSDIIAADLSQGHRISLVERGRLGEVLAELGLSTSGVGDPETAQKVGFLAGARVLVWGQIGVIDQQTIVVGSVVGVETGRTFVEQVRGPRDGDLVSLIDQLAARLAERIVSERRALVAADDEESLEASLNALAEKLKDAPLPAVAVAVEGEVAGSPLASALRTELMMWLVRCGFPVIEAAESAGTAGGAEATVLLTAEASATPGDSYGPLQTARYRLQVRAVDLGNGKVLAVARRAGESAEVTREAASMRGLQAAATRIAAELLPKLAGTPAGR